MSLDDFLGLLFLLLFVILPALQGLRRGPRPPLDLPDLSREEGIPPPKAEPKAPARPRPKPQEKAKAPQEGQGRFSQPSPLEEAAKPQRRKPKPVRTEGNEILKGVIWSEILKKPRGW